MKGLAKVVFSLALFALMALMVYIIVAVLAAPQHGMTYVVAPDVPDWRPPVERCPADVELWDCVRSALYAKGNTHDEKL